MYVCVCVCMYVCKDKDKVVSSIFVKQWSIHRSIAKYILLRKKTTNKLQVHPDKPVS